jgi:transposase
VMRAISQDLRERIHEASQNGDSSSEVAERFAVSSAFVRRLQQRFRDTGSLAPLAGPKGPRLKLADHQAALREAVQKQPDLTAAEYKDLLQLPASVRTVQRMLLRLGLTHKKSRSLPASKTEKT